MPARFGVPVGIFAASRLAQLLLLGWVGAGDRSLRDRLLSWDAGEFVRVAVEGYPQGYTYQVDGSITGNGLAFFPVYPLLIRALSAVMDPGTAALVISWAAAGVLAVLVYALAGALWGDRAAVPFTVLVCTQPMSVVLAMGYSESLLLAFVAGALLAAYRERWLLAGVLGLLAGLTRPTGAAVGVALAVAAVLYVRRRDRERAWRAPVGAALALVAAPAYLLWVAFRVGDFSAWFTIQGEGWGTRFDGGASTARFVIGALRAGDGWVQMSVALLLIAAVVAAAAAVWARIWPPLLVYGVIALVLVVGQSGYYHSKPRLLVPVLVTLAPAAIALGRARPRTAIAVLAGFALFGLWYGAYMITVWRYAV